MTCHTCSKQYMCKKITIVLLQNTFITWGTWDPMSPYFDIGCLSFLTLIGLELDALQCSTRLPPGCGQWDCRQMCGYSSEWWREQHLDSHMDLRPACWPWWLHLSAGQRVNALPGAIATSCFHSNMHFLHTWGERKNQLLVLVVVVLYLQYIHVMQLCVLNLFLYYRGRLKLL